MSNTLDRTLSVTLTLAAVVLVGATITRQFGVTPSPASNLAQPSQVDEWETFLQTVGRTGKQFGDPDADVQLVEFVDFQCPYCAQFHHEVLRPIIETMETPIGVTLVHFPLRTHPLAVPLAVGAECAAEQGKLWEYADAVFLRPPESLDRERWTQLSAEAGLADAAAFVECAEAADDATKDRIQADANLGLELGVRGTPTVLVGGWLLAAPPSADEVRRIVTALRAGEEPF